MQKISLESLELFYYWRRNWNKWKNITWIIGVCFNFWRRRRRNTHWISLLRKCGQFVETRPFCAECRLATDFHSKVSNIFSNIHLFCKPLLTKLPKNDQKDLKFYMIDRVFSSFDKIGSPGFKTWALPRTLIDFYHFIDLLGQAGCNVVVVDINVDAHIDANIAHLVWLKLWAMFTLLPIYLRCPIGFCAHLHTIVFSS